MALLQLLLVFSAIDHGDCHFREESLEKVMCSHFQEAQTSVCKLVCKASVGGQARGARHPREHSAIGLGEFLKMLQ
jgi:hypothetical protein